MGEGVPAPLPSPPPSYNQFQRKKRGTNTRQEGDDIRVNMVIKHLLWGFHCNSAFRYFRYFRYFSLPIISFRIQNIPLRFEAKQAKQTLFFAISLCSYLHPFRFVTHRSEIPGHPTLQGGPGPRFEPGPGSPEAGSLPLDHHTSFLYVNNVSLTKIFFT